MIDEIHQIDFLDGNGWETVPPPLNYKPGIKLQGIFTDDAPSSKLQDGGFEWVNSLNDNTASRINAYIDGGATGATTGIFEGLPYQIFKPGSPNTYIFQGVIDCPKIKRTCDRVVCPVKYVNAIDWFHTLAEAITFGGLTENGLTQAGINIASWPGYSGYNALIGPRGSGSKYEYKEVPYTVTTDTDIWQAMMLLVDEFSLVSDVKNAAANTKTACQNLAGDLSDTPVAPYGTAIGIIQGALDLLSVIFAFAWDFVLGAAILGTTEMLVNQCGILLKYKYAMTYGDIMNSAFDYLNNYLGVPTPNPLVFKSSILDSGPYQNTTWMPSKWFVEDSNNILINLLKGGVLNRGNEIGATLAYGYPDENFKQWLGVVGDIFNAKMFLFGNVVRFEEVHYTQPGTFKLPNEHKPGNDVSLIPDVDRMYNTDEQFSNYRTAWQVDSSEERTMIVYTGTSCAVNSQPIRIRNLANLLPPKGVNKVFSCALAKRKEYLNIVQTVINDILQVIAPVINDIISVINDIITFINKALKWLGVHITIPTIPLIPTNLNALIGSLEVSNDTWNIPKTFIGVSNGTSWYLDANNGANQNGIWNNFTVPASTPNRGEGWMSAWALMNQFHGKNLPLFTPVDAAGNPQPPVNNQWWLYKGKTFKLCAADYQNILGNNVFLTADNKMAKFERLTWSPYDDEATEVDYRISAIYDNNFNPIITIDGQT